MTPTGEWEHGGTCFAVNFGKKQYVVTAKHVTEGKKVRIVFKDKIYNVTFTESLDKDLAITRMSGLKASVLAPRMPVVGDEVYSLGFPLWEPLTISQGIVNHFTNEHIGHSASLAYGNSGGPLFNKSGQVVGVNVSIIPNFSHLNFAVPVKDLRAFLSKN